MSRNLKIAIYALMAINIVISLVTFSISAICGWGLATYFFYKLHGFDFDEDFGD